VRILYVCHRFPYPPKRGGKIRPFNMIRHLAQQHEVVVCSLSRSDVETSEAQGIAPYCAQFHLAQVDDRIQTLRMVATLPTPISASTSFFHSGELARKIDRLLAEQQFDLIFVHCSSVAHYV
jgi:polysaccharide biosynthesis protein PslH